VTDLKSWLRTVKAATKLILVEPRSSATESLQRLRKAPTPASAALLIGAEGGWAAEEISTAVQSGFLPITLGRRILRADAVPVAAVSVLQFIWKDW
jgi:16S rRNA (uracil1498-N3)-methyltransferase